MIQKAVSYEAAFFYHMKWPKKCYPSLNTQLFCVKRCIIEYQSDDYVKEAIQQHSSCTQELS